MSNLPENSIPRRQFLRGAAGLVGGAVVGSNSAIARVMGGSRGSKPSPGSAASYSIAYWDGLQFTPASSLASGDSSLVNVRISMTGFGEPVGLKYVDASFPIATADGTVQVPYQAWTAGTAGCRTVEFTMPLDASSGLTLDLRLLSGEAEATVALALATGNGKGAKLRTGVYVLLPSTVNWSTLAYTPSLPNTPLTTGDGFPANVPQYLVLSIDPA